MWRRLILLFGAISMACTAASATVYSPWILSEHVADTRDEVLFARDPRWANLQGQEKALAVWRYLTDPVTGTWHFADTTEGEDPNWESRLVKDPSKTLNVYGFAVCTVRSAGLVIRWSGRQPSSARWRAMCLASRRPRLSSARSNSSTSSPLFQHTSTGNSHSWAMAQRGPSANATPPHSAWRPG